MRILTKYLEKKREKEVKSYIWGKVLDIGCGPAKAITYKEVTKYFGIELDKLCVEALRKKYPQGEFFSKNLEKEKINLSEKVDTILMIAFIEHIKNYENPIKQAMNNLKEGGKIIITTPTKFGNWIHYIGASVGLFSKEARNDHKTILSRKDFLKIAKEYNLKLKKYKTFELFCNQLVVFER
jgi:SAM-dependent methyltransferase